MSKYNVGDEFIIRIGSTYYCDDNFYAGARMIEQDPLYLIEGFNALVFDESGLDRLQSISKRGAEISIEGQNAGYRKGTEETRNLILHVLQMSPQVRQHIFGYHNVIDILNQFGIDEIRERCRVYDEGQNFAPGDEVEDETEKMVIIDKDDDGYFVYSLTRGCFDTLLSPEDCVKTGRNFTQVDRMVGTFQKIKALDDRIAEGAPVDKEVQ